MPDEEQMAALLFDDLIPTSGLRDFRHGDLPKIIKTLYKEKPTCLRILPPPLKYLHTMDEWKAPVLPTTLYIKPKEFISKDPREIQQVYGKPPDVDQLRVRKTRPRYVMTPAVSMDDIEDEQVRQLLIDNVYTATASKFMKDSADSFPKNNVEAPLPGLPACANPFAIRKLNPSYVSPEWRMESVSWDSKRLRSYCHPTSTFWLNKALPSCRACNEYTTMKAYTSVNRRQIKPRIRK